MTDLIKCDNKLRINKIRRKAGNRLANQVKDIAHNIDINLLALEGLEVRNQTGSDLKVRLVLVRATGRMFLYIDTSCQCEPVSFKEQDIEQLEGHRIVKAQYYEPVPITEVEF